ncbi:LruC domain-containing protein [Mucilaginibacter sp. KACC 22063]|uniref:LruC domain-containing protein n=1 Tax=Mucilaginibacter sp. KACC 22063 TaxID=3025666 RepID=UPI002366E6DB|nr:LruC domain-containing protein [Mucilaginibacter sp. KACC 22063]WDF55674.1 LruC domain-containing protein [Mucilaginibacter sp. KACC 22063]
MRNYFTLFLLAGIATFTSCKKDNNNGNTPITPANKIAPDGFNFATTKNVKLNVTLKDNNNGPIAGVIVSVYKPDNTSTDGSIFKGVTDKNGNITATVTLPASYDKLIIDPAYIGLLHNATASINNGSVTAVIGGKTGYSGDIIPDAINNNPNANSSTGKITINGLLTTEIGYPTGYSSSNAFLSPTNLGRPAYLESTGDVIDASLLSYVNSSLPEGTPVTTSHPEYLTSSAVKTINVTAKSDVWITFVAEGAGYQNTLAYYTYKTGSAPTSSGGGTLLGGIDKITYIFPNASAAGSGGGLVAGDKVKLGTFDAGTSIGFVLIQNAWTGSGVNTGAAKFYSQDEFNPENTAALRKHSVMLYDDVHKLYLLGFEDTNRQTGGSDNDFNDLVVYASANPITAISNNGVANIDRGGDTDGDGVLDTQDAFPNDPTRAFISYYPSASSYSTVAFEDNFPKKGDYDLNDLLVNYRYQFISNASNQVVEMTGTYTIGAAGASFHNGFGVQLPVSASAVASVTGQQAISNYITFASNGVEAGQSKAVIIPFDNHEALIKNPDGSYLINTLSSKAKVTSSTATVNVKFTTPVAASTLTPSAFNPFLISNLRRGYEVHLPNMAPTDKATTTLFGTDDDNTSVAAGRTYVSKENWPWAISFNTTFDYPFETVPINTAYPHFADWAASGGTTYTDWYSNTAAGYRNTGSIYK